MTDKELINNEKYHTCGRCKHNNTPDDKYPCVSCTHGTDHRSDLWELENIESKEKTGHWIDDADKIDAKFGRHTYKCSECGKYAEYFVSGTGVWWNRIKPNFCPNCGIKMIDYPESEVSE